MAKDPNNEEMTNKEPANKDLKETPGKSGEAGAEGVPKKKKMTVVFRKQNSEKNSLKSRPAGSSPKRRQPPKNGSRSAGGTGGGNGNGGDGARAPRQPRPARQPESRPAAKSEEAKTPEKEPVRQTQAQPAKQTQTQGKPAQAQPTKPETAPAATSETKAEAPAEAKPERPAPRFVDMEKVRAADRPIVRTRRSSQSGGRTQGQSGGSRGGQSGNRSQSQGGGYRGGQGSGSRSQGQGGGGRTQGQSGGYRGGQGGGGRTQGQGGGSRSQGQGGYRGGQSGGRSGGGSDFGGMGMAKPSAKNKNSGQKGNNRYDKKNSDDLRRPGVKVSNKDLSRPSRPVKHEPEEPKIKMITIPETLTIRELAEKMKIQPSVIVKKFFLAGKVYTLNQEIDYDTASDIAVEFDVLCDKEEQVNVIEELLKDSTEDPEESLKERPPVVCVMGHVDHGKTSLLDAIRNTNVIAKEAGGITQHIGAYVVDINGKKITFLDTPGHEAFTAMRMRGAMSTDIAVLVVAADDGVMPQTVEAINHAKAAGVEIIVAVNKIDKPGANVEKVKQELTEHGLVAEDWGGSNIFVPVSAKTGEGIEELLEMILLTAEVKELRANPDRNARGLVIEAKLDKGKGPMATVLVQKGTLNVGDTIAAGAAYGKVRAMMDDKGRRVKTATPSMPVEILGLNDVPNAGEVFVETDTEKEARSYAETFIAEGKKKLLDDTKMKLSLDDLFSQIQAGNVKELNLIIKADVQGSVEAVKTSLIKLSNEEVVVKVIHGGVGTINESDVSLAAASNAIIIGFNVRMDAMAKSTAEHEKVDVRLYKVIYQAIEDVEAAMKGMLEPVYEERVIGHAVIRQTFKASAIGTIAGVFVLDGKFTRNCKCRISRDGEQIFDGGLASLKRFKDHVKEVQAGFECGLVFEKFNDLQEDDTIEAYEMVEVSRA